MGRHPDARKAAGHVQPIELRRDHHNAVLVIAQAAPRIVAGDRQRIADIPVVETWLRPYWEARISPKPNMLANEPCNCPRTAPTVGD